MGEGQHGRIVVLSEGGILVREIIVPNGPQITGITLKFFRQ